MASLMNPCLSLRLLDCKAMQPAALSEAVRDDLDAGSIPAGIVCSLGVTHTTAMDPVEEIAAIAKERGIWRQVDAAMACSAMLLPECRHLWQMICQAV